jgi:hypothetical protein
MAAGRKPKPRKWDIFPHLRSAVKQSGLMAPYLTHDIGVMAEVLIPGSRRSSRSASKGRKYNIKKSFYSGTEYLLEPSAGISRDERPGAGEERHVPH